MIRAYYLYLRARSSLLLPPFHHAVDPNLTFSRHSSLVPSSKHSLSPSSSVEGADSQIWTHGARGSLSKEKGLLTMQAKPFLPLLPSAATSPAQSAPPPPTSSSPFSSSSPSSSTNSYRPRIRKRRPARPLNPSSAALGLLAAVVASSSLTVDGHPLSTPASFLCPIFDSSFAPVSQALNTRAQPTPCSPFPTSHYWHRSQEPTPLPVATARLADSLTTAPLSGPSARGLPDRYVKGKDGRWRHENLDDMIGASICAVRFFLSARVTPFCCPRSTRG
jgi:hypothetical protein